MSPDIDPPCSLSEADYIKVIESIRQFYRCETRGQLETLIKETLFPLFRVQTFGASWIDFDLGRKTQGHGKTIFQLGYTQEEADAWQKVYPYHEDITRLFATSLRPVLAFDVDLPRSSLQDVMKNFLCDHPQYRKPGFESLHTVTSLIALVDPPDFNIGIGLTRFQPYEDPFTAREVRLAELIRPSLIHALKFIAINEEWKTTRSLVNQLSKTASPMCLIQPQGLITFCNEAFQNITNLKRGQFLPESFRELIKEREEGLTEPACVEAPSDFMDFITLPSGDVHCAWTRLVHSDETEAGCWLLKMKPVADPYLNTMLVMKRAGLTPREKEIAERMCDGLGDSNISQRLFISPATLKNHFKSIYQKLDVHSRTQLMERLRPTSKSERS
ncbi:hypothetical protein NITGR_150041 [Nitrospina gracilis 3/211]|uniref:HTH luxR-type domain-containing protein n=1 Tax=Nitrospina gracilis (strain 3/211) TaxID=1266370 RepID=M1YWM7_NITG3|nr:MULTISPECIES: LuxR C-terminal-related transcriptional regulator [Nitrospina]MCF8722725.1 DNA-binding CsgD family transcriptional regulator/PAS domain-containing protein [Nitrospina sp. Nb-3]CCQ89673.1 hypothetical protein NITGR_150041 [Nitrospina gracilis 3/211]